MNNQPRRLHKSQLKLVEYKKNSEGIILYCADPFESFYEECDFCDNYSSDPPISEGGICNKHGFRCGWGLTCDDWIKRNIINGWIKCNFDKND